MCFKQKGAIFILSAKPLKLVDHFTYLVSNIWFTESGINIYLAKVWNAMTDYWSYGNPISDKIKHFFHAIALSILLYRYTIWVLTKHIKKKLDGNYARMLCSWTNPGCNTSQNSDYMVTHHLSHKVFKMNKTYEALRERERKSQRSQGVGCPWICRGLVLLFFL